MRKSLGLVALAIAVLVTMLSVFIGCSNEIDGSLTGSLTVRTSSANARTISPTPAEIGIVSYRVNGTFSDNITTFPEFTSSSDVISIENLLVGEWTITIDGLNSFGTVIASKTQIVLIQARTNTAAVFYLEIYGGTGTVSITIKWPSTVTTFTQIKGSTLPIVAGKEGFIFDSSIASIDEDGYKTMTQRIDEFPTGTYIFNLEFLDTDNNSVGFSFREVLNVYNSLTSSKTFIAPEVIFPIETPVISLDETFQVSISCATSGVVIYYTVDGNEPAISSNVYSGPFIITQNTTVKAVAVREVQFSPKIAEAYLEVPAAAPTFLLPANTYAEPQELEIRTDTIGSTIYYTLDGEEPTESSEVFMQKIPITKNTTVKAYTYHPNHSNSAISAVEYKIQAGKPTYSPKAGSYTGARNVSITSATEDSIIHYTINGDEPTTSSPVYSEPLIVDSNTTVKAIAVKDVMESSYVSQATYTIYSNDPVLAPTFNPPADTFIGQKSIALSTDTVGATIYYTLDGHEPEVTSNKYLEPITISENTTIKAYAVKDGASDSLTSSASYLIQPFTPTFSFPAGTYMESKTIGIESATEDTTIYYTLDGTNPTIASNLYTGPISINNTTTVKAIAIKDKMANSSIASSEYVIAGSTGLTVINLVNYSLSIQLPEGWETGTVLAGAAGTATAVVSPAPESGVTYRWFLNNIRLKNNSGSQVGITQKSIEFGQALDEILLEPGPHLLQVEIYTESMMFSDSRVFFVSKNGTIGIIDQIEDERIGPSGGYIFYDKGYYSDGWRYLEAAPTGWIGSDTDPEHIFGYYRTTSTNFNQEIGTNTLIGKGKTNTAALVDAMKNNAYVSPIGTSTTASYAAKICSDFSVNVDGVVYNDWFLPSKDELHMMYQNLSAQGIGGLISGSYISSSEYSSSKVWLENLSSGTQGYRERDYAYRVRPVRAF